MPEGRLLIGTRRYSSWSLRGWLPVRLAGLDVEEVVIPLEGSGATPAVLAATPAGLVPALEHRGAVVWESIAIAGPAPASPPRSGRKTALPGRRRAASPPRCMPDSAICGRPCR